MALGAGSVTPMQMATAYSVFANGGYRVNPWLITRSPTRKARSWWKASRPSWSESARAWTRATPS
jgi:penicillin-binding protein 1A